METKYRHDKKILLTTGMVLLLLFVLDMWSLARMAHSYYFNAPVVNATEGIFRVGDRSRRRGAIILLSTPTATLEFSCADAGALQYVGCMHPTPSMEGRAARIEWVESPVNIISGSARRPISISISGFGVVVGEGISPAKAKRTWLLRRAENAAIAAAGYAALFLLVRKLLSIRPKEK